MGFTFTPAVKTAARLRMSLAGPSGSGKTYSSLAIGTALAGSDGRVALVDTEHGSASKYSDLFRFDTLVLEPPYHPDRFVEAIRAAAGAGYSVLILDSLTHAWSGPGGLLEVVDDIAARMKTTNTFGAWKEATPIQNRLVEAILGAPLHVIATMRSKQDYVQERDDKTGRTVIRKVGLAPQQREGFEYEFDVFGDMDMENRLLVAKTRCPELTGRVFQRPGREVADILTRWLAAGPSRPTQPAQPAADAHTEADAEFDDMPGASATVQPPEPARPPKGLTAAQAAAELRAGASAGVTAAELRAASRPWSADQVVAALRAAVPQMAGEGPVNGLWGAAIDIMEHIGVTERKSFLFRVFGVESSKSLTEAQKWAVVRWAKPHKDDQANRWEAGSPHFAAEFAAVVAAEQAMPF